MIRPACDILPMPWSPGSQGELIRTSTAAARDDGAEAADVRLSPEFGRMAREGAVVVRQLRRHVR